MRQFSQQTVLRRGARGLNYFIADVTRKNAIERTSGSTQLQSIGFTYFRRFALWQTPNAVADLEQFQNINMCDFYTNFTQTDVASNKKLV